MKNIALIRIPAVTFSAEEVAGGSMFRGAGVDAFTDELAERLGNALSQSNVKCSAVAPTFKPYGSGFTADEPGSRYFVTVCAEPNGSSGANVTIQATPRQDRGASWASFGPHFRAAVEAQFPGCDCRWMTVDEFIDSEQSV